jgi:hypothetical protein
VSGIFVDGYGFASADILRDEKSVVKAKIHSALSIYGRPTIGKTRLVQEATIDVSSSNNLK